MAAILISHVKLRIRMLHFVLFMTMHVLTCLSDELSVKQLIAHKSQHTPKRVAHKPRPTPKTPTPKKAVHKPKPTPKKAAHKPRPTPKKSVKKPSSHKPAPTRRQKKPVQKPQSTPPPPPPLSYDLEVQVGPGVSYNAHLDVLSSDNITTSVKNSKGDIVLTVEFFKTTVVPMLPNSTMLSTLDIPKLLNIAINEYVINSLNTVATYITAQVAFSMMTTVGMRTLLRTLLDNPGCDLFPDTACTIPCCAEHDKCYHDNGCTSSSWIYGSLACINCNNIVVNCIFNAPSSCSECAGSMPNGKSCYDNKCNVFYDCPGGCPCSLTSTHQNGCCECPSPCQSPTPTPIQTPTPIIPQTAVSQCCNQNFQPSQQVVCGSGAAVKSSCTQDACTGSGSCNVPNEYICPTNRVLSSEDFTIDNADCPCATSCEVGCPGQVETDCLAGIVFCSCPLTYTATWCCDPCSAGTFSDGSSYCMACPVNTWSISGSTSCNECPQDIC